MICRLIILFLFCSVLYSIAELPQPPAPACQDLQEQVPAPDALPSGNAFAGSPWVSGALRGSHVCSAGAQSAAVCSGHPPQAGAMPRMRLSKWRIWGPLCRFQVVKCSCLCFGEPPAPLPWNNPPIVNLLSFCLLALPNWPHIYSFSSWNAMVFEILYLLTPRLSRSMQVFVLHTVCCSSARTRCTLLLLHKTRFFALLKSSISQTWYEIVTFFHYVLAL